MRVLVWGEAPIAVQGRWNPCTTNSRPSTLNRAGVGTGTALDTMVRGVRMLLCKLRALDPPEWGRRGVAVPSILHKITK